jgi:4-amino-4-deoxy-L-arabinose transferase-like glycosyltransferase
MTQSSTSRTGQRIAPEVAHALAGKARNAALHQMVRTPGIGVLLAGITLLAIALRLYRIDYLSLWGDEAFQVYASRLPPAEMVSHIVESSWNHPPLSYLLMHFWFAIFGFGSLQARLLPAAFGILSVVLIWALATYLLDTRTALLAALLLAVSQFGVMYSQEARGYSQTLFFVLLTMYLFIRALHEGRRRLWWAFMGSLVLMTYSHYYTFVLIAALVVFALVYSSRYSPSRHWLLWGALILAIAHTPWLTTGVVEQAVRNGIVLQQPPPWFAVDKWTFLRSLNAFNNGNVVNVLMSGPWWSYVVGGTLFTVPALYFLYRSAARLEYGSSGQLDQETAVLLVLAWLMPMVLVIGLSWFSVQYDVRYVLFSIAPYYILVAAGASRIRPALFRGIWVVVILGYSAYALHANYFVPYKEDYRGALTQTAQNYQAEDCVAFLPWGDLPLQWSIYVEDHAPPRMADPQQIADGLVACDRVWSIAYHRIPEADALDEQAEQVLSTALARVEETQYFWVSVSLFVPRQSRDAARISG